MAEPDNMVLALLRELRQNQDRLEQKIDAGFHGVDSRLGGFEKILQSVRRALHGEIVLGRYAASEVADEIQGIYRRPEALESRS